LTKVKPTRICKSKSFDLPPDQWKQSGLSLLSLLYNRSSQQSIQPHTTSQTWTLTCWNWSSSRSTLQQKVGPSASSCLCCFGLVFPPPSFLRSRTNPSPIPSSGSSISPSLIPILGSLGFFDLVFRFTLEGNGRLRARWLNEHVTHANALWRGLPYFEGIWAKGFRAGVNGLFER